MNIKERNTPGGMHKRPDFRFFSPTRFILIMFFAIILLGTFLLMLPVSSRSGEVTDFVTSLFTATSCTCVTGLSVVDTYTHWSTFGQIVMLLLIQTGGLGFMTLASMAFFFLKRRIGLTERLIMVQSFSLSDLSGVVRLVRHVLLGTLIIEGSGAVVLTFSFAGVYGFPNAIFKGVFHSVSAFCNAGFDITGDIAPGKNLEPFNANPAVCLTIMALIILGGLGFIVWENVLTEKSFKKLTLHSKMVLTITAFLLVLGTAYFFLAEYSNPDTFGSMPVWQKLLNAAFQSTTTRTAGFTSVPQAGFFDQSKAVSIILMLIGGSPGSCAGGIKTVTAGIILAAAVSIFRGRQDTVIHGRKIRTSQVMHALTVTMLAVFLCVGGAMIIGFFEGREGFFAIIFEAVSAFGTVGLSTGITAGLTSASKLVLVFLMYIGRVGIITFGLAVMIRQTSAPKIGYPESHVIIG